MVLQIYKIAFPTYDNDLFTNLIQNQSWFFCSSNEYQYHCSHSSEDISLCFSKDMQS